MNNICYDPSIINQYGIEQVTDSAVVLNIVNNSISNSVSAVLSNCDRLYTKPTFVTKANLEKLSESCIDKHIINDKLSSLSSSVLVKLYDSFDLFSFKDLTAILTSPLFMGGSYMKPGCVSFIENGVVEHYLVKDPFVFMNDKILDPMNASDQNTICDKISLISAQHVLKNKYFIFDESLSKKLSKGVSEGTAIKLSKSVIPIVKGVSHDPIFNFIFNHNNSAGVSIDSEELLYSKSVSNIVLMLESASYLTNRKNIVCAASQLRNNTIDINSTKNFGILNLLYFSGFDMVASGASVKILANTWIDDSSYNNKVRAVLTRISLMHVLDQALANPYNYIRTKLDGRLSSLPLNSEILNSSPKKGDVYGCLSYDFDICNKIIGLHNIYGKFGKQLYNGATHKLSLDELISEKTGVDANKVLHEVIQFKKLTPNDTRLDKLCYNSELAPDEMKHEMIDLYANSAKNLEQISDDLGRKYGMSVSKSTISNYARKHYDSLESKHFKNRREVREQYNPLSASPNVIGVDIPETPQLVCVKS